jgi:hypothetical protein
VNAIDGLRNALLEYANKYNVSNHEYDIIHGVFDIFDAYVEDNPGLKNVSVVCGKCGKYTPCWFVNDK